MKNEGRKSVGQIQGITDNNEVKNIRTDEKGNMLVKVVEKESENKDETVLYSDYFELMEEKSIEIDGQIKSIDIANYSEENIIEVNGIKIGPNISITIPAGKISTPLKFTGTAKVYVLVKGVI